MQLRKEIKFETLHKSHKKGIIIGVVAICIVGSVLVFKTTRAKYRFTESIPFVRGTINYKPYDFKMMAMYQQKEGSTCTEDSCYNAITGRMPSSGYVINESKSYCTIDGTNKDNEAILKTIYGHHVVENLTTNEKCYLYFDKQDVQTILAKYTKSGTRANYQTLTSDNSGKVYSLVDDDGTSYHFAGAVNNNWIKFANMYWRIIRFNGDGTMRLIYSGDASLTNVTVNATTGVATGSGTQIGKCTFNSTKDDNKYVGYRYSNGNTHGYGSPSTIQEVVDAWYKSNIVDKGYSSKVETKTGFCGDRDNYTNDTGTTTGGGTGTTATYYGAYIRFASSAEANPTPTLKCKNSSDLYTVNEATKGNKSLTYPVGLITADEVNAAGAIVGTGNSSYYLYTGQVYWTLSPSLYLSRAFVFYVGPGGGINDYTGYTVTNNLGVRPVINLRADTLFQPRGDGTFSNPWVVQ